MCNAPKLVEILFTNNPIASIEPKAFDHLPSLYGLYLYGDATEQSLNVLKADTLSFSSTSSIKMINMSYWEGLDFEPGCIKNIQPDTNLDLSNCGIEVISQDVFYDVFKTLSDHYDHGKNRINFGQNPLACDCSIQWIVKDLNMLAVIDYNLMENSNGNLLVEMELLCQNWICTPLKCFVQMISHN